MSWSNGNNRLSSSNILRCVLHTPVITNMLSTHSRFRFCRAWPLQTGHRSPPPPAKRAHQLPPAHQSSQSPVAGQLPASVESPSPKRQTASAAHQLRILWANLALPASWPKLRRPLHGIPLRLGAGPADGMATARRGRADFRPYGLCFRTFRPTSLRTDSRAQLALPT